MNTQLRSIDAKQSQAATLSPIAEPPALDKEKMAGALEEIRVHFSAEGYSWLAPLLEAADPYSEHPVVEPGFEIESPWSGDKATAAEHAAYVKFILQAMNDEAAWLITVLHFAGATITVAPGAFNFSLPTRSDESFSVDWMIPFTQLVPWRTPTDRWAN